MDAPAAEAGGIDRISRWIHACASEAAARRGGSACDLSSDHRRRPGSEPCPGHQSARAAMRSAAPARDGRVWTLRCRPTRTSSSSISACPTWTASRCSARCAGERGPGCDPSRASDHPGPGTGIAGRCRRLHHQAVSHGRPHRPAEGREPTRRRAAVVTLGPHGLRTLCPRAITRVRLAAGGGGRSACVLGPRPGPRDVTRVGRREPAA